MDLRTFVAIGILGFLFFSSYFSTAIAVDADDPFLWLEDIEGKNALAWAKAHNTKSQALLMGEGTSFGPISETLRSIYLATDRIPSPELVGPYIYNFWRDAQHVRGIWRRILYEPLS